MRNHDQCNLAICLTVPQPVYFTWEWVIWYQNQCISAGNVLCGTTTSVFHLAMCYAVPEPVPFTSQFVMRYHNQCISAGNVSCGTTTSATWQYVIRTTNNVFHLEMCHAVPQPVQPSNMFYGTTTSVFHLAMCHMVPQPVYFSWQYDIRYHNKCLSPSNVSCGTTTSAT